MCNFKEKYKSLKKKGKHGAMYVSTVVKIISCVVVGALVISGLAVVTNGAMNSASGKVDSLFAKNYSYEGGGGAVVPGEGEVITPQIINGANQQYNKINSTSLTFRSSAPLSEFKQVEVDGVVVDKSQYSVSEGSTIIKFNPEYAKNLSSGSHNVNIVSNTGTASTGFEVACPAGLYDQDGTLIKSWDELLADCPYMVSEDGETFKELPRHEYLSSLGINPYNTALTFVMSNDMTDYQFGFFSGGTWLKTFYFSEQIHDFSDDINFSESEVENVYMSTMCTAINDEDNFVNMSHNMSGETVRVHIGNTLDSFMLDIINCGNLPQGLNWGWQYEIYSYEEYENHKAEFGDTIVISTFDPPNYYYDFECKELCVNGGIYPYDYIFYCSDQIIAFFEYYWK